MKLSKKQKEVIQKMRDGQIVHWLGGITPRCFFSNDHTFKISTATCLKLRELGLIVRDDIRTHNCKYQLTELGKTIEL